MPMMNRSSTFHRLYFPWPLRLVGGVCLFVGGMAWAIHGQFGVDEIQRADDAVNVSLAIPRATIHDWPGEFGLDGAGRCQRERLPLESPVQSDLGWRAVLNGPEHGGPCVWGNQAIIPELDPQTRTLSLAAFRLDDGRPAWKTTLAGGLDLRSAVPKRAATPACDGQTVYLAATVGGRVQIFAVALDGKLAWQRDAGPMTAEDGRLISPVLFESLVIVLAEHPGVPLSAWQSTSHLTALHRLTGEIIYRVRRPDGDGSAAALLANIGERPQLIVSTAGRITAYDPRRGEPIWWFRSEESRPANRVAWDADRIYVCNSEPVPQILAIRADGEGDVTETHLAWRSAAVGPRAVAPVRHRDLLLCLHEDGSLHALDANSGKLLWRKTWSGSFIRPPIPAGDHTLCLNLQGAAFVIDVTQHGTAVAEWRLPSSVIAPIAATAERLLVRDREGLFCLPLGQREPLPIVTAPSRPTKRL